MKELINNGIWQRIKSNKHFLVVVLGMVFLLITLFAACSQPTITDESTPPPSPTPEEAREPEELEEAEKPEGTTVSIRNLTYELKHQILFGHLEDFLNKYPISGFAQEIQLKGTGNWYFIFSIPSDNISEAEMHLENAYSLLDKGKLPDETKPQPLNKDKIISEIQRASTLLTRQRILMQAQEEDWIQWVEESDDPSTIKEKTIENIIEICDDYGQRLSEIISILDHILTDLPMAIEE